MKPTETRGKRTPRPTLADKRLQARPAIIRLEQMESREIPQSLLAIVGVGSLPLAGGLIADFLAMDPLAKSAGVMAQPAKSTSGVERNVGQIRAADSVRSPLRIADLPSGKSGAIERRAIQWAVPNASSNAVTSHGDLLSLGRNLGGNLNGLIRDHGANTVASGSPGGQQQPTTVPNAGVRGAPAASGGTKLGGGAADSSTPSLALAPAGTTGRAAPTPTGPNLLPPTPNSPGGTLQLAGPATDIITPYQRSASADRTHFTNEFVVRLRSGVSSQLEAARYGAKHIFAYPNLPNVNLWQVPKGTDPTQFTRRLSSNILILDAYPAYKTDVAKASVPNDPLLPAQWHLYNTGQTGSTANIESNVEAAWDMGMTGKGALVSVVDDGQEYTHPDLSAHIVDAASWDFLGAEDDNPFPAANADGHGTSVSGVIAAVGNNSIGTSGVAMDALLGGSRLIAAPGSTDAQMAASLNWNTTRAGAQGGFDASLIDVYNNSWGFVNPGGLRAFGATTAAVFGESAANGRGGLGSVYLFAAGNDRTSNDNTNYSQAANNRYAITVAAVADNGLFASYSTPGASILVSAPSNGGFNGIVTTDRVGTTGTDIGYSRTDYNDSFGGTSSATPFVSGVVAQMLQANPNLSWRDVQHILARSSTRNDPGNADWDANPTVGGVQANGAGRYVNHNYGFGLVNASGAVNLASNWQPVGPELIYDSGVVASGSAIPDNNATGVSSAISVAAGNNVRVERVEVIFNATHPARGDLNVSLTSPSGTVSKLAASHVFTGANYSNWSFTTTHSWDELSTGNWTLNVSDGIAGNAGTFTDWRLRVYGTEVTTDTSGPRLVGITSPNANGMLNGGSVSTFRVQFDRTIDASTFTTGDITFQQVGGSATGVSTITAVNNPGGNDTTFDLALSSSVSTVGNYRVDIGPDISDTNGNLLNQDGDLVNGEATQDKYTEFFTIANQFMYSNTSSVLVTDAATTNRLVTLPAVNITDLNVRLDIYQTFISFNNSLSLTAPGGVTTAVIANRNTGNTSGRSDNGYRMTVLDDNNASAPFVNDTHVGLFHYTDQYRPTNPLSAFNGSQSAGDWILGITDIVGNGSASFFSYSLILTHAGVPNVKIDSVTNTDADRDKVEVTYTISNAAAGAFNLGVYGSTDPFFNINSDTSTGTLSVSAAPDLTVGQHTIELNASLFPDPSFNSNQELYSLVVADPQHSVLELAKFDNYGVLEGITQSPDGTLYVAGRPFTSNTITLTNSDVTFNGTTIGYNGAAINDVFVTGSTEADTINASGLTENILSFLGTGNDTYTGGDAIDAVQGSAGHDTIIGNNGNDRLYGMIGNDNVDGGAGADTVGVGEGAPGATQTLTGGTGSDYLSVSGTSFNDGMLIWDPDGNLAAIGTTLQVQVTSPVSPGANITGATIQSLTILGVEATDTLLVSASYGNDRIELQNTSVSNSRVRLPGYLIGGPGNDSIFDGLGIDRLFADSGYTNTVGDGVDDLHSTDGTPGDTLVGRNGVDTFESDAGDTIIFTP